MASSSADRVRRLRERRRLAAEAQAPLLFERADWRLFIDRHTLPQKAGCEPEQLGRVILKELADNALDAAANGVTITVDGDACHAVVRDSGPGISPAQIPSLFSVNRPLLSSKLKRLPTRGMLGNGLRVVMGAVAACRGTITVTTGGICYHLVTNIMTGLTEVSQTPGEDAAGTIVEVRFPEETFDDEDYDFARNAIHVAKCSTIYDGPSQRAWYSRKAVEQLIASAVNGATIGEITKEVFGVAVEDIDELPVKPFNPKKIGEIGDVFAGCYRIVHDTAQIDEAAIPFCIEAWVEATSIAKNDGSYTYRVHPLINRTNTLGRLSFWADSAGLRIHGCGLDFKIAGAKRAEYNIVLSVITPFLQLTSDGKTPYLAPFREAIEKAISGAAREAYHQMIRQPASMSIKDAAWQVMREAYMKASGDGTLPAKARQIMYAARGEILRLAGTKKFTDTYFTQVLLPDYISEHPEETADWDVIYDARGNLTEPHTDRRIPLGTIQVRTYLGERAPLGPAVQLQLSGETLFPTSGPKNRYGNVLFVEKEGFDELFEAVHLAERHDLAIMSTKGMSVVAARKLIDSLASEVDHIFVLHDFDVSGFSIFGTLGTNSRRYTFENDLSDKIVDFGLRLEDVEEMGLEAETVEVKNRNARRETLFEHGATIEEARFLAPVFEMDECRRVELNAMTSPQLVAFVERKLAEYEVAKVVPEDDVIEAHAQRLLERMLTAKAIEEMASQIARQANDIELPADLADRIGELLAERPELSWDQAAAEILDGIVD
jgi:hypothetical protein